MPLVKIHVEDAVWRASRTELVAALKPIRSMLCAAFNVDIAAAQLAIIPVFGVEDQAPVAAEVRILPKPERTPELIRGACERLRAMLEDATGQRAVIRCMQVDPSVYLTLK